MKNVIASVAKQSLVAFFISIVLAFFGCASKKVPEPEFRPLQMHWILLPGEDESQMPQRDQCVILLTGRLMGESPVQASTVGELGYEVSYGRNRENPEVLDFRGVCSDMSIVDRPECRWQATCGADLNIVVKFDNGD